MTIRAGRRRTGKALSPRNVLCDKRCDIIRNERMVLKRANGPRAAPVTAERG